MAPELQFGMVVLYVEDLDRSLAFYRLLGLPVPDPLPDRPVARYDMDSGVSFIFTTADVARRFDPDWQRPAGGYGQVLEFLVADEATVDATWDRMTLAGYHGRTAPAGVIGPYAAMVDDPDGNVVLITNDRPAAAS